MAVTVKARRPLTGRPPANSYPHIQVADRYRRTLRTAWLDILGRLSRDFDAPAARMLAGIASPEHVAAVAAPEIPVAKRVTNEDLSAILGRIAVEAGMSTGLGGAFGMVNDQAAAWAAQHAGELIMAVDAETKRLVADLVARVHLGDLTADQVAREIRPLLGLTPGQAQAALNYRDGLTSAQLADRVGPDVARAMGNRFALSPWRGGPLDQARIDRLYRQYVDRQRAWRAENIARTESVRAATEGRRIGWDEEIRRGGADGYIVVQTWSITDDDRLCPDCQQMEGERIETPLVMEGNRASLSDAGSFPGAGGSGPPLHSSCRCSVDVTLEEP